MDSDGDNGEVNQGYWNGYLQPRGQPRHRRGDPWRKFSGGPPPAGTTQAVGTNHHRSAVPPQTLDEVEEEDGHGGLWVTPGGSYGTRGGTPVFFAGGYPRTDTTWNRVLISMGQVWFLLAQQDRGGGSKTVLALGEAPVTKGGLPGEIFTGEPPPPPYPVQSPLG